MKKIKTMDDYKTIKTTLSHYEKKNGKWVLVEKKNYLSSPTMYRRATGKDTLSFFRGIGGYERNDYACTKRGYLPIRNTSISPDRTIKYVRDYNFCDSEKIYNRAFCNYKKQFKK